MPITVTILFADNTFIEPGVNVQLMDAGSVVTTATTATGGTVTFDADPAVLTSPAISLAPQQTPPS